MPVSVQSLPSLLEGVESGLRSQLPRCSRGSAGSVAQAIERALFPGGKRIRPFLTLLAARMVTEDVEPALAPAAALEFLHASSLILDDLPCMDDAGLRRSQPSLHLEFGEATAILAALALLNQSYEILRVYPELLRIAIEAIGLDGMIGGQAADLCSGPAGIRNQKTAGLMRLTLIAGPMACGATAPQVAALSRCGDYLGEAYQVLDDLRDRLPASAPSDKTRGQDERHSRANNFGDLGASGCRNRLLALLGATREEISRFFSDPEPRETLLRTVESIFGKPAR